MKLPAILNRDPAAKCDAAQLLLTAAEVRIGQLEAERNAALVGESAEEIIRIDRLLDEQRKAAVIHRDRIAALDVEVRRQGWQQRERERTVAIDRALEPAMAECASLAAELEAALGTACDVFQRLEAKRAGILANWPPAVPRPQFYSLDFSYLQQELFRAFTGWDSNRFIQELRSRLPKIADGVREDVANYIKRCREVSIVPAEFLPPPEPEFDAEAEIEMEDA